MLFDLPDFTKNEEMELGTPSVNAFPAITEWRPVCKTPCFSINFIPSMKEYFLNHWRIQLVPPIAVSFIIYSSYIIYMTIHSFYLQHDYHLKILMTVLMLLFVISYYSIILEGPGYLPFYYPLKMAKRKGNHADYLAGVVSTKMQEAYVSGQKVPTRVNYFKSARRYVIRPDHFCGWTGSFIGKKNHKLFFTFNLWGSIYISLFTIFSYFSVRIQTNIFNNNVLILAISIIYIILGLFFFLMTFNFTILSLVRFASNKTQFELMKKQDSNPFRRSCIENFEDVCGPRKYMFLWPFPIGAFHGVPDEDLLYASTTVDIL